MTNVVDGQTFLGTVQAGDKLNVESGGTTLGTLVDGFENVETGGMAALTEVGAGGIMTVQTGGDTLGTLVDAGGELTDKGEAMFGSIYGRENIASGGYAGGDIVYAGGAIVVANGGVIDDPTLSGGVLNLAAANAVALDTITFAGAGGLLELNAAAQITNEITGFAGGDSISISNLSTTKDATFTVSGDTVTIADGAKSYALDIDGASSDQFSLSDVNGTLTLQAAVCFLAGTAIATPDGTRAIETLAAGDHVLTADGAIRPVRWLGRQTVATRFADPMRVAPIRILAGALGANLPVRDLHVSPDHALMVDGTFVQAGALVNGVSITREDNLPATFTYYHVELADHSLILAEGVPAETFIDNVDRLAFDNWNEHAALDATTAPMAEMAHPRAKAYRQVPAALRAGLLARGLELTGSDIAAVA